MESLPELPVAICGTACRLPGGISSPSDLWRLLQAGNEARSRVPTSRLNIDAYDSAESKPGMINSLYGYFLDVSVDLAAFSSTFFSQSRGEAEQLEPQQRLILEAARESIDDAGEVGWKGTDIGVWVGSFGQDWLDLHVHEPQPYGSYQSITALDFVVANRLSHEMDLRGPR